MGISTRASQFGMVLGILFTCVAVGIGACKNPPSSLQYFQMYYTPAAGLPVSAQVGIDADFRAGMMAYKNGQYTEALRLWLADANPQTENDTLQFFLAMVYLEKSAGDSAIYYLDRVLEQPHSVYQTAATWYLALVHLMEIRPDSAKIYLNHLKDQASPYQIRAQELYEKL